MVRFMRKLRFALKFDKMADKNNKINDEKPLIELIRKVFKEGFAEQEKTYQTLLVEAFQ